VAKFHQRQKQLGKNLPPTIITALTIKALKDKRLTARYHGGKLARPLVFLRWILSDRMMDALIMSAFR
jgi:branched-subunit amino acid transport protein AzlD